VTISLLGTAVQPVSHSATLTLTPNSSNVAGYNVYRSSISNGPYTKLNSPLVTSPTFIDSTVLANQTYYYVATSVDSAGDETVYSNQVSATIPTP
jgi:fibronectin type 3 domain-containing protein